MIWMFRNSRGRPDALLTFAWGTLGVILVKILLSGVEYKDIKFGTIDAALATGVLGIVFAAYTAKRIKVDSDKPEQK